jgi:hypothetical protein
MGFHGRLGISFAILLKVRQTGFDDTVPFFRDMPQILASS